MAGPRWVLALQDPRRAQKEEDPEAGAGIGGTAWPEASAFLERQGLLGCVWGWLMVNSKQAGACAPSGNEGRWLAQATSVFTAWPVT